jgi:hypothetical protein
MSETTEIQINPLHLTTVILHAKCKVRTGGAMSLTRVAPTLKATRDRYLLDYFARQIGAPAPTTWARALPLLEEIKVQIDAQLAEISSQAMR